MECAFPFGNFGLPFKKSRFPEKIPFGETKLIFPFTFRPKFPDCFGQMINNHKLNRIGVGRIRMRLFLPIPFTTPSLMMQPINRKAQNQKLLLVYSSASP